MESAILALVQQRNYVSFYELEREVEGFHGDQELGILEKNVVFWQGISKEGVMALDTLVRSKQVKVKPTDLLVYAVDGMVLRLPLARRVPKGGYRSLHWCPMVLCRP